MNRRLTRLFAIAAATLAAAPLVAAPIELDTTYQVVAEGARVNRLVTGEVIQSIRGVPARPVDSFVYDGVGSTPIDGRIEITVQPSARRGVVQAEWVDEHGEWILLVDVFLHPHHASGLRLGASKDEQELLIKEPLVTNSYLHGDSTAGLPVLPLVFAHLAAWGNATVLLNGEPFENPEGINGIPSTQWEAHLMVTEGVRGEDGTVRSLEGEIYDPSLHASTGATDPDDLEVHLTWHDDRAPMRPENWPPLFTFFYHLVFEDVKIVIQNGAIVGEPAVPEIPERPRRGRGRERSAPSSR